MKADAEDSRRHIIRHLGALTIPLRAAFNIVHSCYSAPTHITSLNAYHIIVTPDRETVITGQYFDHFKGEVTKQCGEERTLVEKALADLKGTMMGLKASVHAEAAFMTLAITNLVQVDGRSTSIADLLPVSAVRLIGPHPSTGAQ